MPTNRSDLDPRDFGATEAAARIRARLWQPGELGTVRTLEEAHPRRPRISVLRVIDEMAAELEREQVPEVEPLPELPYRSTTWRGHHLFICRTCGHKEWDSGRAWEHASHHHPQ